MDSFGNHLTLGPQKASLGEIMGRVEYRALSYWIINAARYTLLKKNGMT